MNPLILVDLDETLLSISMDEFLPAYFDLLGNKLKHIIPPGDMIPILLQATRMMVDKRYPEETLEEVFDRNFYGVMGIEKTSIQPLIQEFYENDFCQLQSLAYPRQDAIDLIDSLVKISSKIVIATNPLFPRKATAHRLSWAGLSPNRYPFCLVTTYEDFHFSKPHPAYLAEIMADMGWSYRSAVMIGNDWEQDILPASQLGLPTYWVSEERKTIPDYFHPASSQGQLRDVLPWIIKLIKEPSPFMSINTPDTMLEILKSTSAALDTLSKRKACENVCEVNKIIQCLCEFDNESIESLCGERLNSQNFDQISNDSSLESYIAVRTELIKQFEKLSPDQWKDKSCSTRDCLVSPEELAKSIIKNDQAHLNLIVNNSPYIN